MTKKQKAMLSRVITTFIIYITLAVSGYMEILPGWFGLWGKMALYLIPYVLTGWDIIYRAFRNIRNSQVFDENFLMAMAIFGAFDVGEYSEVMAAMLFCQVGELFQSYAVNRSGQSITELMDIYPEYVSIEEDGQLRQMNPDNVQVGDIIVVKSGERIPLDGKIMFGDSTVDTSALTSESMPRKVARGDDIVNDCVNGSGLLRVQITKEFDDSIVTKILRLVENASSKKAHVENFITRFARYYTPLVVMGAVLLAVVPPLFFGRTWSEGVGRACAFLVISCPCALMVSVSMSFFSGIGATSKKGVLIKGSNYLETLSEMDTIVFDKTDTLAKGKFRVTKIHAVAGSPVPEASEVPRTRVWAANQPSGEEERSLLELAALTESYSDRPTSYSTGDAWGDITNLNRVNSARGMSGHGARAEIDGHTVLVGSNRLMKEMNVQYQERTSTGTVIYVALDGMYCRYIVISDSIKDEAFGAVRNLKKVGIRRTIILTGDKKEAGEAAVARLGLNGVHAELLPEDKVAKVEGLLPRQTGKHRLAFVGDGINDTPVLSRADVGITMGSMGSGAAVEATGVVLMDDNPAKVADVVYISRKIMSIAKQNIAFALGVKAVVFLMGAAGTANMWEVVFAGVNVSVITILNAIRALSL